MGKARGKRNAAREKVWPGERADQARAAKRDLSLYSNNGVVDWRAVEREADKLLPDMPRIEFGDRIQPQTAVSLFGVRRLNRDSRFKFGRMELSLEAAEKMIGTQLTRLQRRIERHSAEPPQLSDTPIEWRDLKRPTAGNKCDRCGGPRGGPPVNACIFKDVKHYCAACYRLNAIDRRQELEKERAEKKNKLQTRAVLYKDDLLKRQDEIRNRFFRTLKERDAALEELNETIDAYNYWVDDFSLCIKKEMPGFDGQHWDSPVAQQKMKEGTSHVLIRSVPDFTDALLDAIEEAELAIAKPIAHWKCGDYYGQFAAPGDRKPLFYANDAVIRMQDKAPKRVRLDPRSKAARGKYIKAA